MPTFLDRNDPTSVIFSTLRFFNTSRFSPLVRGIRCTILGMYGDAPAEEEARNYLTEAESKPELSPLLIYIQQLLKDRLDGHEWNDRIYPYLKDYRKEGVPFDLMNDEPAHISQIKKIVNALYHAEQALVSIESINIELFGNLNLIEWQKFQPSKIVDNLYDACHLFTHPDLNLVETFGPEYQLISSFLNQIKSKTDAFNQNPHAFLTEHQIKITSPSGVLGGAGELTGKIVEGLRESNYKATGELIGAAPLLVNDLTQKIQLFATANFSDASYQNRKAKSFEELKLSPKKLQQLENAAIKLEQAFGNLHSGSPFQPLNLVELIYIFREATDIVMTILTEAGTLYDTNQDLIRSMLAKLKKEYLLNIVIAIDKIEEETMIRQGNLTRPIMASLKPFYKTLISCVEGFVDFKEQGQDVSVLEDASFLHGRLHAAYQRQAARETAHVRCEKYRQASDEFFKILNDHPNQLDEPTKHQLIRLYAIIQPTVEKLDLLASNKIVNALMSKKADSRIEQNLIQQTQNKLDAFFEKEAATIEFQRQLNGDLVTYLYESMDGILQNPYDVNLNAFAVDEPHQDLTLDQALMLHQAYVAQRNKIYDAKTAYHKFLKASPSENFNELRNLYTLFQPSVITALSKKSNQARVEQLDRDIIHALSLHSPEQNQRVVKRLSDFLRKIDKRYQIELTQYEARIAELQALIQQKMTQAAMHQRLTPNLEDAPRAHFLIRKPCAEEQFKFLYGKLNEYAGLLNPTLLDDLKIKQPDFWQGVCTRVFLQSETIPYPEADLADYTKIDPAIQILKESQQALNIKRFTNVLFHIKEAALQLEDLNDKTRKDLYSYCVYLIYYHISSAYGLLDLVAKDPYVSQVSSELVNYCKESLASLQTLKEPHNPIKPEQDLGAKPRNTIFYCVNSLMVLTQQIEKRDKNCFKQVHQFADDYSEKAQDIINDSDSRVKLILNFRDVVSLFTEITRRWDSFASATHKAVSDNLEVFNTEILADALVEADEWEEKFCVKSGLLTITMKKLLDAYYQGLIKSMSSSWYQIDLVSSSRPFEKRIQAAEKRLKDTQGHTEQLEKNLDLAQQFLNGRAPAPREDIIDIFNRLVPLMKESETYKNCKDNYLNIFSEDEVNLLLNARPATAQERTHLNHEHIIHLVRIYHAYTQGLINTKKIQVAAIQDRISFLKSQLDGQINLNHEFERQYIREAIGKELAAHKSKAKGILYSADAYDQALAAHIQTKEQDYFKAIKRPDDIHEQARQFLAKEVVAFEKQYLEPYLQLESIKVAIDELNGYIISERRNLKHNKLSFESQTTLEAKSALITALNAILKSGDAITKQIADIKLQVEQPRFKHVLLDYHHYDAFTFGWLVQWLVGILRALHIYKSERDIIYNSLQDSVKDQSKLSKKPESSKLGLFSVNKKQDLADPEGDVHKPSSKGA